MVVLITGASSSVSYQLINLLLEQGYDPPDLLALVYSSSPPYLASLHIPFVRADLTSLDSLSSVYSSDIDTVFHIAGETRDVPKLSYYLVNFEGTKNLLSLFLRHNSDRFLFLSSVGVYGFNLPSFPITEDFPKHPTHAYNHSKWLAEQETFRLSQSYGFFASAIRPPFIIGPFDRRATIAFFEFVLSHSLIPLISYGHPLLSFAHNKDVARALYLASIHSSASGEAFNVVSFTSTLRVLFDSIASLYHKRLHYIPLCYPFAYFYAILSELKSFITKRPSSITRRRVKQIGKTRIYDTSKVERVLGFKPDYNLLSTLKEIYNWIST